MRSAAAAVSGSQRQIAKRHQILPQHRQTMACRADSAVSSDGGKRPLEGGEEEASRKAPRTEEKKMEYIDTTVSCNPKLVRHPSATEREWSVFMALTTFLRRKTLEETGCRSYRVLVDDVASAMKLKELLVSEDCLLYTSPSPRDKRQSRMPSSA